MKITNFTSSLYLIALFVGLYQLPMIENTLNKNSINLPMNSYFPYSKNFQQQVEDFKISFNSLLDVTAKSSSEHSVVINKSITEVSVPPIMNKENSLVSNSTVNNGVSSNSSLSSQPDLNQIIVDKSNVCSTNCKVLMIGDSVMGDIDFSLARLLKKSQPTWQVIDAHKVSSGLTNQMYYDWPKTAEKLVSQHKPDYVVVLVGTNDAQGMMINGKGAAFGKEQWMNEYRNRVTQITNNFKKNTVSWYWIQLPVVRDNSLNQKLEFIRQAQKEIVGDRLVETESIFGKTDHSETLNMKLRANDGTHLNSNGANLVAERVYKTIATNF